MQVCNQMSPPSRAAWIEITASDCWKTLPGSPPSRAAWIEILMRKQVYTARAVAAFTGGVD